MIVRQLEKNISNQFIIWDETNNKEYFQSYNSIIVEKDFNTGAVYLDCNYWNYSKTTSKHRNKYLNETTKNIEAKIKSGLYELKELN
jgi:hypothetical protein